MAIAMIAAVIMGIHATVLSVSEPESTISSSVACKPSFGHLVWLRHGFSLV